MKKGDRKLNNIAKDMNEHGFTLVEILFAVSLLCVIVFLFSPLYSILIKNDLNENRLLELEWDVFCSQAKKEIRMSNKTEVLGDKLLLYTDEGTVFYEKFGEKLRRRVDLAGHEILLQHVDSVSFQTFPNEVLISVVNTAGKKRQVRAFTILNSANVTP